MNKNEDKNKKLDSKELEDVSGGEFSVKKIPGTKISKEQLEKIEKFNINNPARIITAYGVPSPLQHIYNTPIINLQLEKKPKVLENTDTSKSDAISELSGDTSSETKK